MSVDVESDDMNFSLALVRLPLRFYILSISLLLTPFLGQYLAMTATWTWFIVGVKFQGPISRGIRLHAKETPP